MRITRQRSFLSNNILLIYIISNFAYKHDLQKITGKCEILNK